MNSSVLDNIKVSTKKLLEKPTRIKKVPSFDETVSSILNATTPARKAHATRNLRAYALSRALKIQSTPTRVIAGVCAAVTKRMAKGVKRKPLPVENKTATKTKPTATKPVRSSAKVFCSQPPLNDSELMTLRSLISVVNRHEGEDWPTVK